MGATSKLTDRTVKAHKTPGRLSDGNRLYLNTSKAGAKSWVVLYMLAGKQREMGLGSLGDVSLAQARDKARAAGNLIAKGLDPLAERDKPKPVAEKRVTFGEVVTDHLAYMGPSWRNAKSSKQWAMTLKVYAAPLTDMAVQDITAEHVAGLLMMENLWVEKPETGSRVRARIEAVLDRATVLKKRTGPNPAAWKGNLAYLLPPHNPASRGHHAAMPYADIPAFMERLATVDGVSALVLRFTILTAARSGEALNATWGELDDGLTVWTIPAGRMKAGREHRVPLSEPARAILRQLQADRRPISGEWVFPGAKPYRPLSNMAMELVLRRLGQSATPHGFRSSFKDWAVETTSYPREVSELALAHLVGTDVERAYRRSDLFERRRGLMDEWASFAVEA